MTKYLALVFVGILAIPSFAFASFTTDLRYGSSGEDVTELQEFLTAQGVYTGPITGYFYSLTLAGVKAFQSTNGIDPVSGFFGPLSRTKANELLAVDLEVSDEEAGDAPVVRGTPVQQSLGDSIETTSDFDVDVDVELGSGSWDEDGGEYQLFGGAAQFTFDKPYKLAHISWWKTNSPKTVYDLENRVSGPIYIATLASETNYSWKVEFTGEGGQKVTKSGSFTTNKWVDAN